MRILFLTHSFNSLTQRLFVVLREQQHEVSVEFDINDAVAIEAVELFQPDLIIAPFLKRAIPAAIWRFHTCLVVHPGIRGDRGPSALDWAILEQENTWGVTVLQANAEMDAGPIWASCEFAMPDTSKSSVYRNEITHAAVDAVLLAIERYQTGHFTPQSLDYSQPEVCGELRPLVKQKDRVIDWQRDDTDTVLRKIRSADGFPGVRDSLFGRECFLYDAHLETSLRGVAGAVIAQRDGAICRATLNGALWIGHLRDPNASHPFKLPATKLLADEIRDVPEYTAKDALTYNEIWYEEEGEIGYLYFPFYNGAMSTDQCQRLHRAYCDAIQRNTRVIVLCGGPDYWSNGMNLNIIEASPSAADESWRNINALNDLAEEIINTTSHLTVAALRGNAGAGGVFLARAVDFVWAHASVILNPHYKDMGNLYGSEFWTYLLPRYAGEDNAQRIAKNRLPMGVKEARNIGLLDHWFGKNRREFERKLPEKLKQLTEDENYFELLNSKRIRRQQDEAFKAIKEYRNEELAKMKLNFYGFDPSYHVARYNLVYKVPKSRTPLKIASHRRRTSANLKRNVS